MRFRALPGAGMFVKAVRGERRGVTDIASAPHVPFAKVAGGITGGFQRASERRRRWIKEISLLALAISGAGLEKAGDAPARGEHSGGDSRARGRADRRRAIISGETSAFPREAIEVRGWRKLAAKAADIPVAHVIGEDKKDVWLGGGRSSNRHSGGERDEKDR